MMPSRVVVIVARHEAKLHAYLQRSLASLADIEVVLDRRAAIDRSRDERRRPSPEVSEHKILLCSIVHCPVPAPLAPGTAAEASDNHRTLLWPGLRLDQL